MRVAPTALTRSTTPPGGLNSTHGALPRCLPRASGANRAAAGLISTRTRLPRHGSPHLQLLSQRRSSRVLGRRGAHSKGGGGRQQQGGRGGGSGSLAHSGHSRSRRPGGGRHGTAAGRAAHGAAASALHGGTHLAGAVKCVAGAPSPAGSAPGFAAGRKTGRLAFALVAEPLARGHAGVHAHVKPHPARRTSLVDLSSLLLVLLGDSSLHSEWTRCLRRVPTPAKR